MADTIRPFVGKRVLEIGSGMGNLTRQLVSGRQKYVATDIDQEHLARLRARMHHRTNLAIERCDATNPADFIPFAGQMDTVICLNILEHIPDDRLALRNISCEPESRNLVCTWNRFWISTALRAPPGTFMGSC
jgi:2-polyprenyl-3-methyl-5-hydroxy-6-metoxy-1,4-benzoquinol methylase